MANRTPKALALTHVSFEDLGSLHRILLNRGYDVQYAEATCVEFPARAVSDCDLLIVLGGPIGVYESADYPFLNLEISTIADRLQAQRPTLGICLGAQLMATALGARVYPGESGSEIGWSALEAGDELTPEWFAPLLDPKLEVLHWHGDTFELPVGAQRLAGSQLYPNQAFAVGKFALGLQFHAEVEAGGLERWYVGHTGELRAKKIDIPSLRATGKQNAPKLEAASRQLWNGWLDYIL
ncbi:MAG: glutamine amidotransferase [Terracidiphilus sp.]|nr:glutamine amidotransferase [Terracidiphilus sp.]